MKVALFTGGLPRFTIDFIRLMEQLHGFSSADIYMTLWKSDWAFTNEQARTKIEKILLPKYKLSKIEIVDQPKLNFPNNKYDNLPIEFGDLRWYYLRRVAMFKSLELAYDLIESNYDMVIRFRLDGQLTSSLDLANIDIQKENLLIPRNGNGYPHQLINDCFSIGTRTSNDFYKHVGWQFDQLMIENSPRWEENPHTWAPEYLIADYLRKNKIKYRLGDFDHVLTTQGRSVYTDKHYHLPISQDPTIL